MSKPQDFNYVGTYGGELGDQIVPRCVIVIAGTPTIPLSYELTMNSELESDTCSISIPLDLIDIVELLQNARKSKMYIPIEIWSGFLSESKDQHYFSFSDYGKKSNDQLKKDLLKDYKEKLQFRWFGIVTQSKLNFPNNGSDTATLVCQESHTILDQYTIEKKYEGEGTTVKAIIEDLQKMVTVFKIEIDKDVPKDKLSVEMGMTQKIDKDSGEKTETVKEYNTVGKSIWQTIKDVCQKAKLRFILKNHSLNNKDAIDTYAFVDASTSSNILWVLDRQYHYNNCEIHEGKFGTNNSNSRLAVVVTSKQDGKGKDGEDITVKGTFPKNLSNDSVEGQKVINVTTSKNKTQSQCEEIALSIASSYNKTSLEGSIVIPNAIVGLKPHHQLYLNDTSHVPIIRNITRYVGSYEKDNAIAFRITSINEAFNKDSGLSQSSVEFELDSISNKIDINTGVIKSFNLQPKDNEYQTDVTLFDENKLPPKLLKMRRDI